MLLVLLAAVFPFPQVILLGMAAWKKDAYMADYSIILCCGGLVALYHHALQMLPGSGLRAQPPASHARSASSNSAISHTPHGVFRVRFLVVILAIVRLQGRN